MHDSLISVAMVFFLLMSGYFSGKLSSPKLKNFCVSLISNVVLLLLFCMGIDFGSIFTQRDVGYQIIKSALLFSALIAFFTYIFLYRKRRVTSVKKEELSFFMPFKGCLKAMTAFLLGLAVFKITGVRLEDVHLSSSYVLSILIFLVGIDLVGFKIGRFNLELVAVPIFTIFATLLAVFVFSVFSHLSWRELFVVSSGLGWFSLSGPMVNKLVSPEMGAMAFMTDFFREMFSIMFLYFLGKKQPTGAIGISGAAALDSALPFIRENCEETYISHAIFSGFVLTVLAPFLISFSVTLVG
ncbi:lysine exporter LysO family protein [Symbiopectobacterium purcellii]|uniref:Lysine exporter LysO family protein n=1 Tax=Symbiopectobacterium purcellii TaxID=2871826 RepID=A0ABX9AMA8_9ENTR|nr:lysine exporter LysO family protein [Symbiopectobacterium purcellii]QZN96325.1 lysine exporter LysO family protein [Symbiopectobacterium purcellii]